MKKDSLLSILKFLLPVSFDSENCESMTVSQLKSFAFNHGICIYQLEKAMSFYDKYFLVRNYLHFACPGFHPENY